MKRIALAAALAALTLTGCGFTPLYATPGVTPALASIEVVAPKGRQGFLLAEQLNDAFATDRSAPPRYKLNLVVHEARFNRGLTVDNVAERYESHYTVHYELVDLVGGKTVKSGQETVEVTYAAALEPYAGVAAQQASQENAAAEAAQRIRVSLAAFFAERGDK
jgi:LPS-assembly lipoprotein